MHLSFLLFFRESLLSRILKLFACFFSWKKQGVYSGLPSLSRLILLDVVLTKGVSRTTIFVICL